MMDRLECAIRRYRQIAPDAGAEMTQPLADQLADWMERDVGLITTALLTRPDFRRRAAWSIERLAGAPDCLERQAVLAVDEGLCHYARSLLAIASNPEIAARLRRLGPYENEVTDGDPSAMEIRPGSAQSVPHGYQMVELIAGRPWRDLASAWDYFHPTSEFNLQDVPRAQWAVFLPFFNHLLRSPGDLIARCMEIRVEHWRQALQRFWVRCDTARRSSGVDLGAQWGELLDLGRGLDHSIRDLHRLSLIGPNARVRESCIALLQVHVGFHHDTDVSWLGPVARMAAGAADIPARVTRQHQWDVPERVAAALVEIADVFRRQSPEDVIEEMRSTRRLVLVEEQRTGYLDGVPIVSHVSSPHWHGGDSLLWELLWTLADRARLRRSVDCYCLTNPRACEPPEPPSTQAVKDRRSDLKKLIRSELDALIVDAGRGTYRLALEPDDICLLGWLSEERLVVLPPIDPRIFSRNLIEDR